MPVRIYAFAKELGLDNKQLLEICEKANINTEAVIYDLLNNSSQNSVPNLNFKDWNADFLVDYILMTACQRYLNFPDKYGINRHLWEGFGIISIGKGYVE